MKALGLILVVGSFIALGLGYPYIAATTVVSIIGSMMAHS